MVESMIIDRLHRDGAFPWIGRLSKLHLCFLLRRHEQFRYTFASAVGKRMASERLMSSSRASIIEHHRSASWAEREYLGLYNFMNENASVFESALRTPKDDYMLCDYTDMEKKDDQRQRSRLAKVVSFPFLYCSKWPITDAPLARRMWTRHTARSRLLLHLCGPAFHCYLLNDPSHDCEPCNRYDGHDQQGLQ